MLTSPSLLHCGKCGGPSHIKGRSNIAKAELASSSATKFGTSILYRRPPRPSQVTIFIIVKVIKVIIITNLSENFRCQGQVCHHHRQNLAIKGENFATKVKSFITNLMPHHHQGVQHPQEGQEDNLHVDGRVGGKQDPSRKILNRCKNPLCRLTPVVCCPTQYPASVLRPKEENVCCTEQHQELAQGGQSLSRSIRQHPHCTNWLSARCTDWVTGFGNAHGKH